jgi:hypothetical protein
VALEERKSKSGLPPGAILLGGGAAVAAAGAGGYYIATRQSNPAPTGRTMALVLAGKVMGNLKRVSGGQARSDVVTEATTGGAIQKHLAAVRYEEIAIELGLYVDPAAFDPVSSALQYDNRPSSGALLGIDGRAAVSQSDFLDATVSELQVPKMDGASKDGGYFGLKLRPESTRASSPSVSPGGPPARNGWLVSNFRLNIDGVATDRVASIDAFSIKFTAPATVDVPNLKLAVSLSGIDDFVRWHKSFVIDGEHPREAEKNGSIQFLAPDLKTELGRLDLLGLGIVRLGYGSSEANSEKIARADVELYCTEMRLRIAGQGASPAAGQTPTPAASPSATAPSPSPSTAAASPSPVTRSIPSPSPAAN